MLRSIEEAKQNETSLLSKVEELKISRDKSEAEVIRLSGAYHQASIEYSY